jgi:hypothetical protein
VKIKKTQNTYDDEIHKGFKLFKEVINKLKMIPRNVGSARMSRVNSKVNKDGLLQENIDLKK